MSAATVTPIDFDAAAAALRVSLWAELHEVWQGTIDQLCRAWDRNNPRPTPGELAAKIDATPVGVAVLVASLPGIRLSLDFRSPDRVLRLKRTHYYQDGKTGSLYTRGEQIPGGSHWDRRGPIRATLGQTQTRTPLVTLSTGFGFDGDYTPEQIRRYAHTLLRIADDAAAQPMGPRSFYRSVRGYDT